MTSHILYLSIQPAKYIVVRAKYSLAYAGRDADEQKRLERDARRLR